MKTNRQSKIIEIIQKNEVETQDELSALLEKDGFRVTQATVPGISGSLSSQRFLPQAADRSTP